jgi:serine/threonine protein kinase
MVILLCIVAIIQIQHLYLTHRQSLAAKYSPTTFSLDSDEPYPRFRRPDDEDSQFQDDLLANRASWRVLGAGWEGKVFTYKDYVIKTFTPGRSPFRNCAPGGAGDRWPTEIPASLQFGAASPNDTATGFLPVKAYFKVSPSPVEPEEWHLVTPLLRGGNLNTLSQALRKNPIPMTYRDIDAAHRPAFNRLLETLQNLHSAGYCHDDIKPANIFIQSSSHWILGDLGNLRHIEHPYHSSRLWKDNGQLEDCRANDVLRALKSYIKFIQASVHDEVAFNAALFRGEEPLSRLLWWTMADERNMSAEELRRRSGIEAPRSPARDEPTDFKSGGHMLGTLFPRRIAVKYAADRVLRTRMGERMARWWAMVWLFDVPVEEVCGV